MKKYINGEYIDLTSEEIEELKKYTLCQAPSIDVRVEELEKTNQIQDELINISLLATDEMFCMLEPLLSSVNIINAKGVSKMVDMYVAMVQRGLKTIEDVPLRYREEVKRILEALEK